MFTDNLEQLKIFLPELLKNVSLGEKALQALRNVEPGHYQQNAQEGIVTSHFVWGLSIGGQNSCNCLLAIPRTGSFKIFFNNLQKNTVSIMRSKVKQIKPTSKGAFKNGSCSRHSEHSKSNVPEPSAWPDSHTENHTGSFPNHWARELLRTSHAADAAKPC